MPMWDLECPNCLAIVEDVLLKRDEELPCCHVCQTQMTRRYGQRTSFLLKGPGWAQDGYSKDHIRKNNQRK